MTAWLTWDSWHGPVDQGQLGPGRKDLSYPFVCMFDYEDSDIILRVHAG